MSGRYGPRFAIRKRWREVSWKTARFQRSIWINHIFARLLIIYTIDKLSLRCGSFFKILNFRRTIILHGRIFRRLFYQLWIWFGLLLIRVSSWVCWQFRPPILPLVLFCIISFFNWNWYFCSVYWVHLYAVSAGLLKILGHFQFWLRTQRLFISPIAFFLASSRLKTVAVFYFFGSTDCPLAINVLIWHRIVFIIGLPLVLRRSWRFLDSFHFYREYQFRAHACILAPLICITWRLIISNFAYFPYFILNLLIFLRGSAGKDVRNFIISSR